MRFLAFLALALGSCGGSAVEPPKVDTSSMEAAVASLLEQRYGDLVKDRGSASSWGQYAMALHAHNLCEPAAVCYERAHALDPATFDYPFLLAYAREQRGEDVGPSLGYLAAARAIDPGYPPLELARGNLLAGAGRLEEAREAFEAALALDPEYGKAHANLGEVLVLLGEAAKARTHLERASLVAPDDRSVVAALSRAMAMLGETEEARRLAERVPELRTTLSDGDSVLRSMQKIDTSSEGCLKRAKLFATEGRWSEVVANLKVALEERGDEFAIHSRMGHALLQLGRPSEARGFLERTLQLNPDHAIARLRLANVHAAEGRKADARRELDVVLVVDPTNGEALTLRGLFHLEDGQLGAADAMFQRAKGTPQGVTGEGYMLWGVALAKASRMTEAADALRAFVDARPERADGRYALGVALQQSGRLDDAVEQFAVALELDPKHPLAPNARALVQGR